MAKNINNLIPKLLLLFNHRLTPRQATDVHERFKVDKIIEPPKKVKSIWSKIPPEYAKIASCLDPVKHWLSDASIEGDYVLIQGDFGACYLMVQYAFQIGLIPIYSTTERCVDENISPDGTVNVMHRFRHVRFRKYEK